MLGDYADVIDDRRSSPLLGPSDVPERGATPCPPRRDPNRVDIPKLRRSSKRKSAKAAGAKVRKVFAKEDKSDDDFDEVTCNDILGDDILSVQLISDDAEGEDESLDAARVRYGDDQSSYGATANDGASNLVNAADEAANTNTDIYDTARYFGPEFADPFYKGSFSHSTKGILDGGSSTYWTDDMNKGQYQRPDYTATASTQMPRLDIGLNPAESPSASGWTRLDNQQVYPTVNTLESYGDFGASNATFDHLGGQNDYYNSQPSTAITEHFPNHGFHESQPSSASTDHFPADTYNDHRAWGIPDYNDSLAWGLRDHSLAPSDVKPILGQDLTGYDGTGMGDSTEYRFN